ncbi:MAG: hypothetical protein WC325_09435 [Candidatus Bathyarchaeia archaeon]
MLFLFCLNLAIGVAVSLNIPGTVYVRAAYNGMNVTEYEAHFNSTEIATGWQGSPFSGIPMIGDIFAGFNFLWQNIAYLVDGFPALLTYIDNSFITTSEGHVAFYVIEGVLRAIYALLISMFLIEFISGRIWTD